MIPFSPPRIDEAIIEEVSNALRSGWITTGPRTKQFELEISEYVHARKTLCVASATAGLELMMRWMGIAEGDEVIIPAYTYCATANVVVHCGATPVMVDTKPGEFNIDSEAIRNAITPKTKAIVPVDIAGWPCDYNAIREIVEDPEIVKQFKAESSIQKKLGRIAIIADSAHGFGAQYQNQPLGSVADITVFSFHAVKNLTTAEGGAICMNLPNGFDVDEIYKELNTLSLHGQSKDALAKSKKGGWRYDVLTPGYKCNMTDIQAAIGLIELRRYKSETLPRRKAICQRYNAAFAGKDWAILPTFTDQSGSESSYHLYQLRIKGATEPVRDAMIQCMADVDIAVNVHFLPLPMLTAYKDLGYDISDYPNTYKQYQNEISLPVYFDLTDDQVDQVAHAIISAYEKTAVNA